jgi:hypothetical protein
MVLLEGESKKGLLAVANILTPLPVQYHRRCVGAVTLRVTGNDTGSRRDRV